MIDEKYQRYLASREWSLLKEAVKKRCGGICERCHKNPMQCVHHLTYARKYNELLTDLAGWCKGCHEFIHAKSNTDPAAEDQRPAEDDGINFEKLTTFSELCAAILVAGERAPVVKPLDPSTDQMDFDRLMCECGIKKFVRPLMNDQPSGDTPVKGSEALFRSIEAEFKEMRMNGALVLVEEQIPGIRTKQFIQLIFPWQTKAT